MKKAIVPGLVILVFGLALAEGVLASNGFALQRSVIGGGGERVTGGGYILNGTVGEPIASDLHLGASYGLSSGFWWPRECRVYLPVILRD